jgi:nucleoside-diphosphate-sugar epimerase
MRRALVTGGTGMLGSYIVRQLRAAGCEVRALARDPARAGWLRGLGAEIVRGDLGEPDGLIAAAAGCDVVFHAAAAIGPESAWEPFRTSNVEGTAAVVRAAADAGARLLHVSSTAVYGAQRYEMAPVSESAPLPDLPESDAYGRSKQEAERLVLRAHERGELWATVIRPPVMYGERDRQFIPRIAPIMMRGIFPLIGGGRTTLPVVHASAVAEGALRAVGTNAAEGRVYNFTTDFPLTVADLVRYASEGLGRYIFAPVIPAAAGGAFFSLLRATFRVTGHDDLAGRTDGMLRMLTHDNPFVSERARKELGWQPSIRPEVGVPEAMRWWLAHRRNA